MIGKCVVDASVGVKLFVEEPFSDVADRLFDELANNFEARFYAPDLFFVECANILWKYVRRFGYPPDNARQDVMDLQALAIRTVSTADLLVPALDLAMTYHITTYDASYAALACQLSLPLITADERLARRLTEADFRIVTLSDLNASL